MTEQLPFRGRVKTWKRAFGYGFVTRDDFRDVFVHANVLKGTGISTLEPGDPVTFDCDVDRVGRLRITKLALDGATKAKYISLLK
jgi:CspA family cold shock protein